MICKWCNGTRRVPHVEIVPGKAQQFSFVECRHCGVTGVLPDPVTTTTVVRKCSWLLLAGIVLLAVVTLISIALGE